MCGVVGLLILFHLRSGLIVSQRFVLKVVGFLLLMRQGLVSGSESVGFATAVSALKVSMSYTAQTF